MDMNKLQTAADFLRDRVGTAEIGIVLGSGLGDYVDALENGAHPACIACSDDHAGMGGRDDPAQGYGYTGMTGVYAAANTREAIFDALKARRCYGFMGEKAHC